MPQNISCPDCGRKLRVPDNLLGKKVKCPGCGVKFVGEAAPEPEEELPPPRAAVTTRPSGARRPRRSNDDEGEEDLPKSRRRRDEEDEDGDDHPAPRRRGFDEDKDEDEDYGSQRSDPSKGDVRQGWERVRFGVNLVITAAWISVATIGVAISGILILALFVGASLSTIVGGAGAGPMNQQQAGQVAGQAAGTAAGGMVGGCMVIALVVLLCLAIVVTRLTGLGFCMGVVPTRKTQALKGLAIAAFSLSIANLVLPMLSNGFMAALGRNGGVVGFAGQGLTFALSIAEIVCFFLFLRGTAVAMRKDALARNLVFYLVGIGAYAFLLIPMAIVALFLGAGAAVFGVASARTGQAAAANAANAAAGFAMLGVSCFILLILIGVGLFVWYMVLLYQVRSAVDGWLARH